MTGWSGGQYSVYRVLFGAYLSVHFAQLLPYGVELFSSAGMLPRANASPLYPLFPNLLFLVDGPGVVLGLLGLGLASSLAFALGLRDRVCALLLWYVWACLFTRNPLISNPSLAFVGWLLLAHALLPRAPYGSWDARGRSDPGGGWILPPAVHAAAWMVMALAYSYSGYTKLVSPSWIDGTALLRVLENPLARPGGLVELVKALPGPLLQAATWSGLALELLFAPLALVRRLRPWLWLALAGIHLTLIGLIDFADLSLGMLILHGFTFDPAWIPARRPSGRTVVYYDGSCGLCHGTVRFLLAEDRSGEIRYAPLESAAFAAERERPADLPDSLVVRTNGRFLVRATGVLELGHQLGGLWRVAAFVIGLLPRRILDLGYDGVAASRQRLFARPPDACPLVPAPLRERFLG